MTLQTRGKGVFQLHHALLHLVAALLFGPRPVPGPFGLLVYPVDAHRDPGTHDGRDDDGRDLEERFGRGIGEEHWRSGRMVEVILLASNFGWKSFLTSTQVECCNG